MKEQNVEKIAWSDITLGAACALLERFGGWFDGDERAVIVGRSDEYRQIVTGMDLLKEFERRWWEE